MDKFFKNLLSTVLHSTLNQIPNEVGINIRPFKKVVTGEKDRIRASDIPDIIKPKNEKLQVVEFVNNGRTKNKN